MILQALHRYYDRAENMPHEGWVRRGVDYVVVLDLDGGCVNIEPVGEWKKNKLVSREMLVPAIGKQAMKHTNSGKDANLLWDNASFVFGTGNKGAGKLKAFISTLQDWLGDVGDPGLAAIVSFCGQVTASSDLAPSLVERFGFKEDFKKRDPVLIFRLTTDVEPIHVRLAIRSAYETRLALSGTSGLPNGDCLVTGRRGVPLALNESVIKGVWGGQSAGCNIVSFNARAFESYGKKERNGENAPIGASASFAYTTALNHLLDRDCRQRVQVGDASTVFWAERPSEFETLPADLFGEPPKDDPARGTRALDTLYRSIHTGHFVSDEDVTRCHMLGLAPNAARIAVRFWQTGTAAELGRRLRRHFDDLKVARGPNDPRHLSLFRLLAAIAVQGKADNIPPNLGGEIVRAVLAGDDVSYPAALLNAAVGRCRAEQRVSYARAAILKACINRGIRRANRSSPTIPEKEFSPMLDTENPSAVYRLGRLFAALEKIQEEASPGLNATIRDRYYGAASSTPVAVFTTLLRLKNHHLGKLSPGRRVNLERLIGEIMGGIGDFPRQLPLPEQGRFALGYYHQRQDFYTRKPESNISEGEPQ